MAGAGAAMHLAQGVPNRSAITTASNASLQLGSPLWRYTSNEECKSKYSPKDAEKYGWWFCYISRPEPPTVMIVGSSFANHLYPGFANHPALAGENVLSIGSCRPEWIYEADIYPTTDELSPCTPSRRLDQQQIINETASRYRPKLIIVSGLGEEPDDNYTERLGKRISFFEEQGARVVLVLPQPTAEFNLSACFGRRLRLGPKSCDIPYEQIQQMRAVQAPLIERMKKTNPRVQFFDTTQVFCTFQNCSFIKDKLPLFRDQYSHFSEFGSSEVAKLFFEQIHIRD